MSFDAAPTLTRVTAGDIAYWTDERLHEAGVVIAFTERTGGVSREPYATLNLAAHVGDNPEAVDENRARLLDACGLSVFRAALTVPDQVHGTVIHRVTAADAGAGSLGRTPIQGCDALLTKQAGVPLLLCFADCVPIVLVAPGPAIAVVHAGWRGALAGIARLAAERLCATAGCEARELSVYIGPHVGPCHYEVDTTILSQFVAAFGTLSRAESGRLDLGSSVAANLTDAGVQSCRIASLGRCTAEEIDRFFSYRAEAGLTGRHGAVACIAR